MVSRKWAAPTGAALSFGASPGSAHRVLRRRRPAEAVESVRSRTKGAPTIDANTLLRLALAVTATALLVATFVVSLWVCRTGRRDRVLRPLDTVVLLGLLAALSILLALAPPNSASAFPTAQAILLAISLMLLTMSLSMRTRDDARAAQLVDTATVDALTRVASHRVFQDRLAHECDRAYRFGDCFMLVLLDLDDFHRVNNRYGHRVGDKVLLGLARRLQTELREIDLLARFGADRFVMILPHTYEKGGTEVGERLRQSIAGWVFHDDDIEMRVTVSVGLCAYPADGSSPPELIEAAQKALAFAKAMGGNQVQLYRDLPKREAPTNVVSFPHVGRGAVVRSLAAAVDIRDGYTHEHSRLVSELSAAIARRIGLPSSEVARVRVGALLHDVGKIGVPDAVLAKEGGLSTQEWETIRRHPILGKQIMEQAPELTDVIPLVLHHQERYDGTGYPAHLCGETIPLGARIIAASDAYHAIRSDRPYRSGRTHHEAIRELQRCSGGQFDPQVVDTLLDILENDDKLKDMLLGDAEHLGLEDLLRHPPLVLAPAPRGRRRV